MIELYVEHCVDVPNIIDDVGDFTQSDCDMDEGDDINIFYNSKDLSGSDDDAFDKLVMGPVGLG